jgi:hypothetical protein
LTAYFEENGTKGFIPSTTGQGASLFLGTN